MAEPAASDDATVTFSVKSSGGQKYTLTLPLTTTTQDLKNKLSGEEYANVPASAQRLIYSGKVLKDNDTLALHKVKDGNTMHLVKSAPSNQRQNPANQASTPTTTTTSDPSQGVHGVPTNLASGTGNDPLAGLTGARYAGFAQLPSADMFTNPPSQEQIIEQLSNPHFAQMMNEALQNPQVVDMMIQQNPQLRAMGPQARQMLQSDHFRRMMTDPEALRSMMNLQRMMGGEGAGGQGAFPAPGVTNTTDPQHAQNTEGNTTNQQQQQANPFAALGGLRGLGGLGGMGNMGGMGGLGGGNPFASLFNPAFQQAQGQTNDTNASATPHTGTANDTATPNSTTGQQPAANPFAQLFNPAAFGQQPQQGLGNNTSTNPIAANPEAFQQFLQAMGGARGAGAAGAAEGQNPYANLFNMLGGGGFGGPPDNRPPEERFSTQLRQLNEMGFHDFNRNIQALTRSGGDVNGALEYLFNPTS